MINWKRIWLAVLIGSFAVLAFARSTNDCIKENPTLIPPNLEVVLCQTHFPKNNDDGLAHVFCHLKEIS